MAKVGGRNAWIAWPAAVICAAIIAVLFWLAAPGVPGAISFIGDTLRSATSTPEADATGADVDAEEPATDCQSLYPDRLWVELTWTTGAALSWSQSLPATTTTLTQALSPDVRFTCTWTAEGGRSASTTLADVAEGSSAIVQAALSSEGFACGVEGERVHCERTAEEVIEIHDLRGGEWLSTVLTNWAPEEYGPQTVSRAFPD